MQTDKNGLLHAFVHIVSFSVATTDHSAMIILFFIKQQEQKRISDQNSPESKPLNVFRDVPGKQTTP